MKLNFLFFILETNKLVKLDHRHSYAKIISDYTFVTFDRQDEIITVWQCSKHDYKSKKLKMIELASFDLVNSVSDKSGMLIEGINCKI